MTFGRLLLRNLLFHRRGNLAVSLGVVVGTAVLTGALLVGDSLRGSLRELALKRLGWVDSSLVAGRFFREEVAKGLPAQHVAPAVLLQAAVSRGSGPRVNKVVLFGVDGRFWQDDVPLGRAFWHPPELPDLRQRSVVLGAPLARDLGVRKGDTVTFHLEKLSAVPRESFLGKRKADDVQTNLELKVIKVLPDDHPGSQFSLRPTPSAPRNAYLPLTVLQEELHSWVRPARSLPEKPVNAILVKGGETQALQDALHRELRLEDWGLLLRERTFLGPEGGKYLSRESHQMFVEPAVLAAVEDAKLTAAPTLVYMVNNLATVKQHAAAAVAATAPPVGLPVAEALAAYYGPVQAPYLIVAALDPSRPPPLGPFLPEGLERLGDDQILLVQWDGSPLSDVNPGAAIALTYYHPGEEGRLREETTVLRLAAQVPMRGVFRDRNLTPQFAGITDRLTLDSWDPPFPFDRTKLRPADNRYWTEHRATPKAYVTLKTGQKLWGNRFGQVTSIRIAPPGGDAPVAPIAPLETVTAAILRHLKPDQGGFVFQDVRAEALTAGAGSQDFGMLFLGFSAFLILAALLLVGLLFRLNLDRRAGEIGLLLATGFRRRTLRLLFLAEGALLALLGGAVGLAGAVLYAGAMLNFLSAQWPGGLDRSFLGLHVTAGSLVIGYFAALAVSMATIFWATRTLARVSPRALLTGETAEAEDPVRARRRVQWSKWLIGVGLVGAAVCFLLGTRVSGHEEQAMCFFGSGALLLTAGLAAVWLWLRGTQEQRAAGRTTPGLGRLAVRNAARHPVRSLLTVGLLASATFLVVAVQAFHRDAGHDFLERTGGSGGFALLAESEVPVFQDLNDPKVRAEWELSAADRETLRDVRLVPFRVRVGDDASCLNLYQPRRPRLLGVPASLITRGGFHFAGTEATSDAEKNHTWLHLAEGGFAGGLARSDAEKNNPWLLLQSRRDDGAIPVFGEANTVTWMLHKGLGKELTVPDDRGNPVRLRIVGLLQDSVFQSELLMSEENFLRLYPRQEGYQFFLIDVPTAHAARARSLLETAVAGYGLAVTPSAQRLESFLAVENTYLATFQALGGLGLLLGAMGLAIVLLRGVWERRGELALFRALGFRRSALGRLVLMENAYLLALGLGVGVAAALLAVAPHLAGGALLWLRLLGLLGLVLLVGLAAGAAAVLSTLRAPLLPALRRE
jgi:ABC-type lipoprotein release transport system permease subunit